MHEKGLGVEKDEMKAEELYLRAGSRGEAFVAGVAEAVECSNWICDFDA